MNIREYLNLVQNSGYDYIPSFLLNDIDDDFIINGIREAIVSNTKFLGVSAEDWAEAIENTILLDEEKWKLMMSLALGNSEEVTRNNLIDTKTKETLVEWAWKILHDASEDELVDWGINPFVEYKG